MVPVLGFALGVLAWLLCGAPSVVLAHDVATAEQLLTKGEYARAQGELQALLDAGPAPAVELVLARLLHETGRYVEAAEACERAAREPALQSAALTRRGESLEAVGRLDDAERAYRGALHDRSAVGPRTRLGRLLMSRGRTAQARPFLRSVLRAYDDGRLGEGAARAEDLASVAMAARALGEMHDANDLFREAAAADRARVETQLEWAQLFLEKYDAKHAAESVLEALGHNKHHPLAHVLMARLTLGQSLDFATATDALDRALAANPNLVAAHVTRAGMALRNMELAPADALLDRALRINPVDLEALSMRAAVRFLADDPAGFERAKAAVLAQNPRYSRLYAIVSEYAEWEHRYEALVAMSRAALRLDPHDAVAHATLGLNLLRLGEERAGLAALREAWKRDHFNAQVFNTLNLYEREIATRYVTFEHGPFRLRLHAQERPILEPYLVPLVDRAYSEMRERYGFSPRGPLWIELYADREHFSVRTTGLPNVGVQGVCFGKVVTGLSPRGGPYNWGQIVWHELSHVFHLQLSDNHVPRWFTEGLAEYETTRARPEWKREDDLLLWRALRAGRLPSLSAFNRAFTQARSAEDLMTAYYAAFRIVGYVVERFGFSRMRPMLVAWGAGKNTDDVVREVLGVPIDTLDHDFRAHVQIELARFDREFQVDLSAYSDMAALERAAALAPEQADAWAALALGRVVAGDFAAAAPAAARALRLAPKHPLGHFALARIALERRDVRKAERCLRGILAGGSDGYVLRIMLARAALSRGDAGGALRELEEAVSLDPEREDAWKSLLEVAQRQGDGALALRALAQLSALDQHDRSLHEAYALLLARQDRFDELVREGEAARYIAPASPALHHALGRAYLETGDPKQALVMLDRALGLGSARPAAVHRLRMRAFSAIGDEESAKKAERESLALDPGGSAPVPSAVPAVP